MRSRSANGGGRSLASLPRSTGRRRAIVFRSIAASPRFVSAPSRSNANAGRASSVSHAASGRWWPTARPCLHADAFAHCKLISYVDAVTPLFEKAGIAGNLGEGCVPLKSAKDVAGFVGTLGRLPALRPRADRQDALVPDPDDLTAFGFRRRNFRGAEPTFNLHINAAQETEFFAA